MLLFLVVWDPKFRGQCWLAIPVCGCGRGRLAANLLSANATLQSSEQQRSIGAVAAIIDEVSSAIIIALGAFPRDRSRDFPRAIVE
ncbi:uncharacterized protein EAF01_005256 [Botrytis porri]|uniref:uncharacterized protein n=1 Tax=Botrytis porri TaxID=87229 RepID=UPI0019021198|nr:uncharacterized protein EAF01_005256 [Botrytis porri]KAF7907670.1 hypothetical protein EAF01_005256 [Botrytis porri]